MSTRSIIVVTGNNRHKSQATVRLYKHCDGYPTGNLPLIAQAIRESIETCKKQQCPLSVDTITGKLIGYSTDAYGIGCNIEHRSWERVKPDDYGNQGDLEWIYLVDVTNKTVSIFGGGYTGDIPQNAVNHGEVDPMSYITGLVQEYQKGEREYTEKCIKLIQDTGFVLNPNLVGANQKG